MKRLFTLVFLSFVIIPMFFSSRIEAQENSQVKSVFWKISGKDLSTPSFLFGTFHLLNGNYLNKIEKWKRKFDSSRSLIVEMVIDSSKMMEIAAKMVSPDTTLDKLLSETEYEKTSIYFKEVSGMDLSPYNSLKPISLSVLLTTYTWAKLKPEDYVRSDLPMDLYFVQQAKDQVKKIIPLETMEQQVNLLYDGMPLKRQKELLMEIVNDTKKTREGILKMDECYRKEDLQCLQNLIYNSKSYQEEELNSMLKDRNLRWMENIVSAINDNSTFIAVGAGHLPGEYGLINLLRKEGYNVEPLEF